MLISAILLIFHSSPCLSLPMDSKPHLLLIPGPGLGHINGSMVLAKFLLSTAGFSISCVCFAHTYNLYAKQNRLRALDPAIRFEVLDDGLSLDSKDIFFKFTQTMRESLVQLVERLSVEDPVCCIISDTFMAWTQDVADRFRIPRVDYWTSTATAYLLVLALPDLISKGYLPMKDATNVWRSENPTLIDFIPGLPQFNLDEYFRELRFRDQSDEFVKLILTAASRARNADKVLIHSLHELESSAFEGLRDWGIQAYAVGPLIQFAFDSTDQSSSDKQECERWLDTQADSSVIYVSFGSSVHVSDERILELAFGLEASGQPFLWVIRSDPAKGELSNALPEGFESRTKERGRVVSWAPQVAVLAHPAVGGFLTHCGWNSTLESIWMGVPLLACPNGADQINNARHIAEDWGVGIELGRTKEGGWERAEVERAVKALMIGKEGEQVRSKVRELQETARKTAAPGGHSHNNLLKFVHDVRTQCRNVQRHNSPPYTQ